MCMRYPAFLQKGQTIGYVAPSFGCATEPYKTAFGNALDKFEKLGYGADLGPNVYVEQGIGISNTPQACGQELTDSYCSDKNQVILSCGGGEMMCETIGHVDWERLKQAKPKWYMGFSDNTNFTFLSNTLLDTAAIYGPCASAFGMEPWHPSVQDALDVLTGKTRCLSGYDLWERESVKDEEHPLAPYNVTEPVVIKKYPDRDLAMEGRLIGGCMDCLVNLLGTEFDHVAEFNERYAKDGILWFLEACDLNTMAYRRAFWQMKHAGWFQNVRGFLIGRPLNAGEMFGTDQYQTVIDMLGEYDVPILMDLDIGHLSPMMPIVSGSTAEVTTKGNEILIHYTYR